MFKPETHTSKTHASGSWRAIRSMAVPAGVKSMHSSDFMHAHHSGIKQVQKIEQDSIVLKPRKTPGYFETADASFSNS